MRVHPLPSKLQIVLIVIVRLWTPLTLSQISTASTGADYTLFADCRICYQTDRISNLLRPCNCEGTLSHAHYTCLESLVKESRKLNCEICGRPYTKEVKEKLAEVVATAQQGNQQCRCNRS